MHRKNETKAIIEKKLNTLNTMLGLPTERVEPDGTGGWIWNAGVYHCDMAYNGYSLVRMSRHGGSGTENVAGLGFVSGNTMVDILNAMIIGVQLGKEYAKKTD